MRVIGLDTSTATGGVALLEGERLVAEYTLSVQRTTHAERLLPALQRVMEDAGWDPAAGVDGVAVAIGPGSFTGLRIGVVTAKALSYAWGARLVGVPTLDAMAYQAAVPGALICPGVDARHGHLFCAAYRMEGEAPAACLGAALRPLDEWVAHVAALAAGGESPVVFVGDGIDQSWDELRRRFGSRALRPPAGLRTLRSGAVAGLGALRLRQGRADDPAGLAPMYLRASEAERKWQAKHRSPS